MFKRLWIKKKIFRLNSWELSKSRIAQIRLLTLQVFFYRYFYFINYKNHFEGIKILVKFLKMAKVGICSEICLEYISQVQNSLEGLME